jgi:hypothetical protein
MEYPPSNKTEIKPFTKILKRKFDPKHIPTADSETKIGTSSSNDGCIIEEVGVVEHDGEGDIRYLKESPCVGLSTIIRWKNNNKVDLNCFLGFADNSSEEDKAAGTDILNNLGKSITTMWNKAVY